MDAEIAELSRAVMTDETQAPRLARALARVYGDPEARLRKLLSRANAKCRVPGVDHVYALDSAIRREMRRTREAAFTVPWVRAMRSVKRVLKDQSWACSFGGDCFGFPSNTDGTCVLVSRADGSVTVGVGIVDVVDPRLVQAWPSICSGTAPCEAHVLAWARDRQQPDRVVFTFDEARALATRKRAPARKRVPTADGIGVGEFDDSERCIERSRARHRTAREDEA